MRGARFPASGGAGLRSPAPPHGPSRQPRLRQLRCCRPRMDRSAGQGERDGVATAAPGSHRQHRFSLQLPEWFGPQPLADRCRRAGEGWTPAGGGTSPAARRWQCSDWIRRPPPCAPGPSATLLARHWQEQSSSEGENSSSGGGVSGPGSPITAGSPCCAVSTRGMPWWEWPAPLAQRRGRALDQAGSGAGRGDAGGGSAPMAAGSSVGAVAEPGP